MDLFTVFHLLHLFIGLCEKYLTSQTYFSFLSQFVQSYECFLKEILFLIQFSNSHKMSFIYFGFRKIGRMNTNKNIKFKSSGKYSSIGWAFDFDAKVSEIYPPVRENKKYSIFYWEYFWAISSQVRIEHDLLLLMIFMGEQLANNVKSLDWRCKLGRKLGMNTNKFNW